MSSGRIKKASDEDETLNYVSCCSSSYLLIRTYYVAYMIVSSKMTWTSTTATHPRIKNHLCQDVPVANPSAFLRVKAWKRLTCDKSKMEAMIGKDNSS